MSCTCADTYIVGQCGTAYEIHCTTSLSAECTTHDGNVIIEVRGIFQTVSTCCSSCILNNDIVSYSVTAICISRYCTQVFNHSNIWYITTCIIGQIRNVIIVYIQLSFVVQALARLTARSIAYHTTCCVDIVATVC